MKTMLKLVTLGAVLACAGTPTPTAQSGQHLGQVGAQRRVRWGCGIDGRRAVILRRLWRGSEAVSEPRNGRDHLSTEQLAQRADLHHQVVLFDHQRRPEGVEQIVLGDELTLPINQGQQHIEGTRAQASPRCRRRGVAASTGGLQSGQSGERIPKRLRRPGATRRVSGLLGNLPRAPSFQNVLAALGNAKGQAASAGRTVVPSTTPKELT